MRQNQTFSGHVSAKNFFMARLSNKFLQPMFPNDFLTDFAKQTQTPQKQKIPNCAIISFAKTTGRHVRSQDSILSDNPQTSTASAGALTYGTRPVTQAIACLYAAEDAETSGL